MRDKSDISLDDIIDYAGRHFYDHVYDTSFFSATCDSLIAAGNIVLTEAGNMSSHGMMMNRSPPFASALAGLLSTMSSGAHPGTQQQQQQHLGQQLRQHIAAGGSMMGAGMHMPVPVQQQQHPSGSVASVAAIGILPVVASMMPPLPPNTSTAGVIVAPAGDASVATTPAVVPAVGVLSNTPAASEAMELSVVDSGAAAAGTAASSVALVPAQVTAAVATLPPPIEIVGNGLTATGVRKTGYQMTTRGAQLLSDILNGKAPAVVVEAPASVTAMLIRVPPKRKSITPHTRIARNHAGRGIHGNLIRLLNHRSLFMSPLLIYIMLLLACLSRELEIAFPWRRGYFCDEYRVLLYEDTARSLLLRECGI
jgi:hypothetical protein